MGVVKFQLLERIQKEKILADAYGKHWVLVLLHWEPECWVPGGKCTLTKCGQGAGRVQRTEELAVLLIPSVAV